MEIDRRSQWPRISIVTPCLNAARFVEKTIQSVLSQRYPNLEYIVIDGGSTDGTQEIIRRYEKELTFWVSEPDRGMYDAINKGFARSTGEIMAWLNADDMYMPWTLHTVREILGALPEVRWLTSSTYLWLNETDEVTGAKAMSGFCRSWFRAGLDLWGVKDMVMQESTFWRRDLWEESDGRVDANLRMAGDYELWQRFWAHTELYAVSSPLAAFRMHPTQKTVDTFSYITEAEMVWRRGGASPGRLTDRVYKSVCRLINRHLNIPVGRTDRLNAVEYNARANKWSIRRIPVVP